MNERQSNAIATMMQSTRAIAGRLQVSHPDLAYWHQDNEQQTTVLLERLRGFLGAVEAALALEVPQAPESAQRPADVLTALRSASVEELTQIPYIGLATAKKIKAAL